ncbi:MAG: hypothetical protein ACE5EQ_06495 [Phycisphaerae bacterium]
MSTQRLIDNLRRLRTDFNARSREKKRILLTQCARDPFGVVRDLRDYHDLLLFMAATPDDAEMLRIVNTELRRIARITRDIMKSGRRREIDRLVDSGMAGTVTTCAFSVEAAAWLARRFGRSVELDWEDGSAGEKLDEFLNLLVAGVERDGLLSDRLTTREWNRLARGSQHTTDLAWLVDRFNRLEATPELREQAFESLDLRICWRLTDKIASRTFARFPRRPTFFQDDAIVRAGSLCGEMARPLPATRRLPIQQARDLLDVCRTTLCVRHREIDTLTYASERDVTLFQLDRGVDVAVFGMVPDRRLPIESYYGFVAARNRVPIGYGGGWLFGDRCEIGVNIFDAFRGGESGFVFRQIMRVYHQFFGARRFFVDPYQFGADNAEAIRSGAYWFYDRLGFRPTDEKARQLAETERSKRIVDRAYRSPARILRRLARSKLAFDLDGEGNMRRDEIELSEIGLAVTRWIGCEFDGDREAAGRWAVERARRDLGERGMSKWPPNERRSFERLSMLLGPISDLSEWTTRDKKSLVALMRAKGGISERRYIRAIRAHAKLRAALLGGMVKLGSLIPHSFF